MDDDWKDNRTNLRECVMMNKANLAHRCSNAMISVNALATFLYFIESHSKAIGDAAYETVWYELSTSECRILLFVILRSQKQLTITAGKVMNLTLEGFTNYSYFFAQLGTNDFSKLMDGLSITLDYTLTFLKLLSLWHNRRIFSDILGAMNDDWNNCSTHTCMMMNKANLAHRCSNVMLTLNSLSVIFYFAGNYVSHRTSSTDFREFPIQIQFPFHATDSPIFEFIVLGLFLHVWETAIVIALLNSLILTLSKSISDAAYETLWYDLSTSECRILLLIIVRSQKRLTITAGKIMDLTLEGFTSVRF
ncbi:hypothetical protein G5I_13011 [Acromyrmex echinatior]|uniref:Odorant receptor 13a n=1 Tax=Acromyrmex echinatior TaxID=103372 RepID=F4X3U8_ACREC|nr:hypothetical protein G5I_13011 [Acromyrmex echinatior]